jgi:hypothetical protein
MMLLICGNSLPATAEVPVVEEIKIDKTEIFM